MLVLTFQVDGIPYAVPVSQVIEVIPRVELRPVPHAPRSLLGLLHYRGGAVPVVDLGLLLGATPCVERLDTRILLVRAVLGGGGDRLGLVAERVNELVEVDADRPAMASFEMLHAPYLGRVFETTAGLLQLIDPGRIDVAAVAELPGVAAP